MKYQDVYYMLKQTMVKEALLADPKKIFNPLKLVLASFLGDSKKQAHQLNRLRDIYGGRRLYSGVSRPERLQKLRQAFAATNKLDDANIFANYARMMEPPKAITPARFSRSWLDAFLDSESVGSTKQLSPEDFQKEFSKIFSKLPKNTKKVIEVNTKYKNSL